MRYGFFDDAKKEYVIATPATPMPWINYLGSKDFFSLISNTAGGYCFYRDAKLQRLLRYRYNNVPADIGGRFFYVKEAGKAPWSPTFHPCDTPLDAYRCRHGHTSASRPDPRRPKNLYVREDHLLARLPTLHLLLTADPADLPETQVPGAEDIIGWLHARRIELVYDPRTRSLRADLPGAARVIVDRRAG